MIENCKECCLEATAGEAKVKATHLMVMAKLVGYQVLADTLIGRLLIV
jgi:hypothetical protein